MKALILDQSEYVVARLAPALEQEGYSVESAHSLGEARWRTAEAETDVVVVCSSRPGTHDVPAVEALRQDGEQAPVLVLERHAEDDDVVAVLDAGADDVVVSPVPFSVVAARLRALRRRPRPLEDDDLQVGTLTLRRSTQEVLRETPDGRVPLELTLREFRLLELLMRHAGQVVSRTRLLDHAWGTGADYASNIVEQAVSRLRAKVDHPFGRADVVTIRGAGYRFGSSSPSIRRRDER